MDNQTPSKTQTSFLRRLLVAYLIDTGKDTVPKIMDATGMPRRTAQDTIKALHEIEINAVQLTRGQYQIDDWGAVNRDWVELNIDHITKVLSYPRQMEQ